MKWIILAGSSDTRKTLTELAISLVRTHGARLIAPMSLPVPFPAVPPSIWPFYADDTYELQYRGKKVVITTDGDSAKIVDDGFEEAKRRNADVFISASRARSKSGHLGVIDAKVTSGGAEVFIIAALDNGAVAMPAIVSWRIQQIIDMI